MIFIGKSITFLVGLGGGKGGEVSLKVGMVKSGIRDT